MCYLTRTTRVLTTRTERGVVRPINSRYTSFLNPPIDFACCISVPMAAESYYDFVVLAHQANTIRQYKIYALAIATLARLVPFAWRDPIPQPLGGHYGVTRSLNDGLRRLGVRFAYAPLLHRTRARAAIVLAGLDELRAAMAWRRRGGCELLLAGPNIVDRPEQLDGIVQSPEIDRIVLASDKMQLIFEAAAPQLAGRICVWPAGVDENYWRPTLQGARKNVLVYNKRMPRLAGRLMADLGKAGFSCENINYGDHRKDKYRLYQFRDALDRSLACVLLTENEPQGICATEAWSMDVPTMAYRAPGLETIDTVPYLTAATGRYWSRTEELIALLKDAPGTAYKPRDWVLANMTDKVCATRLMTSVERGCAQTGKATA